MLPAPAHAELCVGHWPLPGLPLLSARRRQAPTAALHVPRPRSGRGLPRCCRDRPCRRGTCPWAPAAPMRRGSCRGTCACMAGLAKYLRRWIPSRWDTRRPSRPPPPLTGPLPRPALRVARQPVGGSRVSGEHLRPPPRRCWGPQGCPPLGSTPCRSRAEHRGARRPTSGPVAGEGGGWGPRRRAAPSPVSLLGPPRARVVSLPPHPAAPWPQAPVPVPPHCEGPAAKEAAFRQLVSAATAAAASLASALLRAAARPAASSRARSTAASLCHSTAPVPPRAVDHPVRAILVCRMPTERAAEAQAPHVARRAAIREAFVAAAAAAAARASPGVGEGGEATRCKAARARPPWPLSRSHWLTQAARIAPDSDATQSAGFKGEAGGGVADRGRDGSGVGSSR